MNFNTYDNPKTYIKKCMTLPINKHHLQNKYTLLVHHDTSHFNSYEKIAVAIDREHSNFFAQAALISLDNIIAVKRNVHHDVAADRETQLYTMMKSAWETYRKSQSVHDRNHLSEMFTAYKKAFEHRQQLDQYRQGMCCSKFESGTELLNDNDQSQSRKSTRKSITKDPVLKPKKTKLAKLIEKPNTKSSEQLDKNIPNSKSAPIGNYKFSTYPECKSTAYTKDFYMSKAEIVTIINQNPALLKRIGRNPSLLTKEQLCKHIFNIE